MVEIPPDNLVHFVIFSLHHQVTIYQLILLKYYFLIIHAIQKYHKYRKKCNIQTLDTALLNIYLIA